MSFYGPSRSLPRQFRLVLTSFLQRPGLPFADALSEDSIQTAFEDEGVRFGDDEDAVYTPAITLWAFLSQVLYKGEHRPPARTRLHNRCPDRHLGLTRPARLTAPPGLAIDFDLSPSHNDRRRSSQRIHRRLPECRPQDALPTARVPLASDCSDVCPFQVRRLHLVQYPGNHHRSPSLTRFNTLDPSMSPSERPSLPRPRQRYVVQ